ncbi:MAG TPA: sensor histidine kinase, partial [Actinotalea sp.]|nr:sensor histidine kinase [Actinotalea sp.]
MTVTGRTPRAVPRQPARGLDDPSPVRGADRGPDDAHPGPAGPVDPDEPGWRRPRPGRNQLRADLALAAGVFVAAVMVSVLYRGIGMYPDPASGPVTVLVLAVTTLPLALRRRYPSA